MDIPFLVDAEPATCAASKLRKVLSTFFDSDLPLYPVLKQILP